MTTFEQFVADRWGDVQPLSRDWLIATMGLGGETGECLEPLKKHYRDGKHPGEALKLELGDVLHYLTVIARSYGWTLDELMSANMEKLLARDRKKNDFDVFAGFQQPPGYTSDL
jgi:NTP pyrophosphatase (non-canonical NTP hydrolase)